MIDEFKTILVTIFIIIIGLIITIYISFYIYSYNQNNQNNKSFSEKKWIISNYNEYSKYFVINKKNEVILKVIDFNRIIKEGYYYSSWHVNEDFDLCLGYYVIKENDAGKIEIDDNHICELLD